MSQDLPDWLGPIIKLSDFEGDPLQYIAHLFSVFKKDFISTTPVFRGQKILFDKKDEGGKPRAFIHITTEEDKNTKERNLSLRRCERISWVKQIIEHFDDPRVLMWEAEHFGKKRVVNRTYLFLECDNFLVILEETKKRHFMITAIYVDLPHQRRKHIKAYEKFLKRKKVSP